MFVFYFKIKYINLYFAKFLIKTLFLGLKILRIFKDIYFGSYIEP